MYNKYKNNIREFDRTDLPRLHNFSVSLKYNGQRCFLIFENNKTTLHFSNKNIPQINNINATDLTVIDCEYFEENNKIYAFDTLVFNNQDIRNKEYIYRYSLLKNIIKSPYQIKPVHFPTKTKNTYSLAYDTLNTEGKKTDNDGLVFTPIHFSYFLEPIRWKPIDKLTIDIFVYDNKIYCLAGSHFGFVKKQLEQLKIKDYKLLEHNGTFYLPINMPFDIPNNYITHDLNNKIIIETNFVNKKFAFYRHRIDKKEPNFIRTVHAVLASINYPITINDIKNYKYTPIDTKEIFNIFYKLDKSNLEIELRMINSRNYIISPINLIPEQINKILNLFKFEKPQLYLIAKNNNIRYFINKDNTVFYADDKSTIQKISYETHSAQISLNQENKINIPTHTPDNMPFYRLKNKYTAKYKNFIIDFSIVKHFYQKPTISLDLLNNGANYEIEIELTNNDIDYKTFNTEINELIIMFNNILL